MAREIGSTRHLESPESDSKGRTEGQGSSAESLDALLSEAFRELAKVKEALVLLKKRKLIN